MGREPRPMRQPTKQEEYEGCRHLWENETTFRKWLAKLKELMEENIPRRCRIDQMTPAEKAILDAAMEVEKAGAHPMLTKAVELLAKAQTAVADFVDGK
jgi:hypothetical protein